MGSELDTISIISHSSPSQRKSNTATSLDWRTNNVLFIFLPSSWRHSRFYPQYIQTVLFPSLRDSPKCFLWSLKVEGNIEGLEGGQFVSFLQTGNHLVSINYLFTSHPFSIKYWYFKDPFLLFTLHASRISRRVETSTHD